MASRHWGPPCSGRPRSRLVRRFSQRQGTVSPSLERVERLSHTWGAATACCRSWAARPSRCSGSGSPAWRRMGRLSHGSGAMVSGQQSSLRPPRTRSRASWERASQGLQMTTLPVSDSGLRTASADNRLCNSSPKAMASMAPPSGASCANAATTFRAVLPSSCFHRGLSAWSAPWAASASQPATNRNDASCSRRTQLPSGCSPCSGSDRQAFSQWIQVVSVGVVDGAGVC